MRGFTIITHLSLTYLSKKFLDKCHNSTSYVSLTRLISHVACESLACETKDLMGQIGLACKSRGIVLTGF